VLRVLDSVRLEHDPLLVLLAVAICAFGAISTLNVAGRVTSSKSASLWLALLSVCAGSTAWATHFIAMLAYNQGAGITYEAGLTTVSFAAGAVIMGLGFVLAIRAGNRLWMRASGGAITGVGVAVLHYMGMAGLKMPVDFTLLPGLVISSVILSVAFGAVSLLISFESDRPLVRLAGATFMVLMIGSLHFTGMSAVHVHAGSLADHVSPGGVTRSVATAVAIAAISVLLIGMVGAVMDQRMSRRIAAEAGRFRTLADGAFEGLIVHRGGIVVDANAAACRLLGVPDDERDEFFAPWFAVALAPAFDASDDGRGGVVEVTLKRRDGTRFPAEVCRRSIELGDGGRGELCAIRDLTNRKESEARIAHLALHDPLTELPNRRFFMELANKAIAQAQRTGEGFALLALDLDDFKHVNDTQGHAAGDELIRVLTQRVVATLRDTDVAARFGGDEFAIVQTCVADPAQTLTLAERILYAVRAPVQLEYGEVALTASIGIAMYPADCGTVEELLRNADTAMYRAKADGKAAIRFFEPHMDAELIARRKLEVGLRRAVAEERLRVEYQPIVDSHSRQLLGFEALVRWTDPETGEISPSNFIPVAEGTGLIIPIGELVLRQACFEAVSWPEHLRVAVNLSAVQFRRQGLVAMVRRALADTGLPGNRLELEVTETLLMDNRQEALRTLNELKAIGVRISMDDFGTGYSALSYLQSFPFDKIKIDRVFVTDLASNPQNASIVRAVAAMGRSLKMRVVAEGVETDHEAELLKGLDCDELQGYLIAEPMEGYRVHRFLETYLAGKPVLMRSA
jgi:diguanylate cyclase (GGDEF)-like protein/PAS domain S-box-containing protein